MLVFVFWLCTDSICDVNQQYLSQVGNICAICYQDYNWSYRLLWIKCCKPNEHTNGGKVSAVYYAHHENENYTLWRVRPLPESYLHSRNSIKRCVIKNCIKGRKCPNAHSKVEMIFWEFQEGMHMYIYLLF